MDKIIIAPDAAFIIEELRKNGFEGHIVGGCVRDALMGTAPHDYDITTSAKPEEVKKIFDHTFDTGIEHGTVTVVLNKANYEVTTFRVDGSYEDCRHPKEVSFTRDLHEDLLRRDFTMNAIAYNPYDGFTDIFGGMEDIKNKIIRGVGEPAERFREDALRMLRAVRFSAQLGFDIEPETRTALMENAGLIKNISSERIREELTKLLLSEYTEKISLLWETGLLGYISKRLSKSLQGHEQEILGQFSRCKKIPAVLFAVLTQFVSQSEIKAELSLYKFDNKTLGHILVLNSLAKSEVLSDSLSVRVTAAKYGIENTRLFYFMKQAMGVSDAFCAESTLESEIKAGHCLAVKDMKISGRDLIALGFEPGKRMGEVINAVFGEVLKNPQLNTYENLEKLAKEIFINNI